MAADIKPKPRRTPPARPTRPALEKALARELPEVLAEVLLPALEWRLGRGRITVLAHNPLFVHGPPGCGKSHLLSALAQEFRLVLGRDAVVELSARDWVGQQAQQLAERGPSPLRSNLAAAAVIVLDDVQELANRSVAQEQLFHLINDGLEAGQQLVFAGSAQPKHLPGIEERLATRFAWGLTVGMDQPTIETRVSLLRELAGAVLDDADPQELGQLVEVLAPDMHQVGLLAERYMRGERVKLGEDKASFDRILEQVADLYGVRPGEIAGKRRHRLVAQARQTALLLGRRLTGHSLVALGGMVGGRDHSTVLYLIRQGEERAGTDPEYQRLLATVTQRVLA